MKQRHCDSSSNNNGVVVVPVLDGYVTTTFSIKVVGRWVPHVNVHGKARENQIMLVWMVVGDSSLNVIDAYVPQVGLSERANRKF